MGGMFGGSVSAPAPDPALAEANIESLNMQTTIGKKALANAEEMMPLQREQMQFGLDSTRTAYDQSQADRSYALEKRGQYDEAVNRIADESSKFDEANRRQELMQQAQADVSTAFSAGQDQLTRGLNRASVMPSSGKAILAQQQGELAEAGAKSRAGRMVSEAAHKEGLQLRGQTAGMLAGYPAQAASLTPAGANFGMMGIDTVNAAGHGMGQGLATASGAAAQYGQYAGDMWNNASRLNTQAQTSNENRRNEMIGTVVGAAGSYYGSKYGKGGFKFGGDGMQSNADIERMIQGG